MKEINIFGSFGFGNIGDEIIPQCFSEAAGSTGGPLVVNTFSRYNHTIVESVLDHNEYLNRDIKGPIFVCGGGIVENHPMSCLNRAMERKSDQNAIIPFAISVEPGVKFSFLKRLKLHNTMKKFGKVYVRDRLSSKVLRRICPKVDQEVVGDLGLWCHSNSSIEIVKKLPDRYFVFIPSDNWKDENFIRWVSNEIIRISEELGCLPVILPISFLSGADDIIAKRIYDRIVSSVPGIELIRVDRDTLGRAPTGTDIAAALANSDLTVSMRLHGCVISYAQKTPFVALAYHPKLQGFLETVEWEFAMSPSRLPPMQTPMSYGYRFSDMNLGEQDLLKSAIRALNNQSYHMLEEYKGIQRRVLGSIF